MTACGNLISDWYHNYTTTERVNEST